MAGNAAAASIGSFVAQGVTAFMQAATSFVSCNIGARKPRRALLAMWCCQLWSFLFSSVLGLLAFLFGRQLLSLYNTDPEVISWGMQRLTIVYLPYFITGFMEIFSGALRGIGYSLPPMIISLLGACAFRIVWILTVFKSHPTLPCLLSSFPFSWIITSVVMGCFFFIMYKRLCAQYTHTELTAL